MTTEPNKQHAMVFACYTWACYCLLQRQWHLKAASDPAISLFVDIPLQWLCVALISNNIRLFLGSALGKEGASVFLGHIWQFMHMLGLPLALSCLAAVCGFMIGVPWMRFAGGSLAVFYGMNGLNSYVSTVHGNLIYMDNEDIPRYTVDKDRKPREGEPPTLLLPALAIVVISATVTLIAMVQHGDKIPFLIQVLTIIGQFTIPSYQHNKHLLINLLHILSLASLIRVQRYVTYSY